MTKNKKISILILVLLVLIGGFFFVSHLSTKKESPLISENQKTSIQSEPVNTPINTTQTANATLQINGVNYDDQITAGISVYDFMSKLRSGGKINFTEKNYVGMGEFIVSINGVANSQKQSWIYYVNGKEAGVGISNYKINPGDVVSWKYEQSNY